MATALYVMVSLGLLVALFLVYAASERARRRYNRCGTAHRELRGLRGRWSFDPPPDLEEEPPAATVRTSSNSRGWR